MPTPPKRDVTLGRIAQETGLEVALVRDILKEASGTIAPRDVQDRVFKTARRLGYDFRKLKIGKRMQTRKETLEEVLGKVAEHEHWTRDDVLRFLKESLVLVDRVHKRVFSEEYGADG